jgi:hypothetical protein
MIAGENYQPPKKVIRSNDVLFIAALRTAHEIGGDDLLSAISEVSDASREFPSTEALQFLEMKYPGISSRIFTMAEEMQEEVEMNPPHIIQTG